jgi:putative ABC transport system permease protein
MNTKLKLAWRNIWRNKKRTIITVTSILIAVFFANILNGILIGFYGHAVDNMVSTYSGYIQVHNKGYWHEKTLEYTFEKTGTMEKNLASIKNVTQTLPRLESFALAATNSKSKPTMVVGTDTKQEVPFTNLNKKLIKGTFLQEGKEEIMIAEGLATYLNVSVGDTLTLVGSGYQGANAEGKYPICGILKFPVPELNSQVVYMNLSTSQVLFSAPERLTAFLIKIDDKDLLNQTRQNLLAKLGSEQYEVMPWQEIMPDMKKLMETEQNNTSILIFILYIVVGFGVLGTVLMMTSERSKEFGVLVAIGMNKTNLISIVLLEMMMLGAIGIILGIAVSLPVIYHFHENPIVITGMKGKQLLEYGFEPIMPLALRSDYIFKQAFIVLIFIVLASLYPLMKIRTLSVMDALRSK